MRLLLQALGQAFVLAQIDVPASQADRFTCRIAQDSPARANQAIGPIFVPQSVLDLILRERPGKQAVRRRRCLLPILGMQQLDPGLEAIGQFCIAITDKLLPARGEVHLASKEIPVIVAVVGLSEFIVTSFYDGSWLWPGGKVNQERRLSLVVSYRVKRITREKVSCVRSKVPHAILLAWHIRPAGH